jgi:hypothetical protein
MAGELNRGFSFPEQQRREPEQRREQASGVMETAKQAVSSVSEGASQAWDATREQAQEIASNVSEYAGDALENATDFMRRYPIATLCAGFGLGFLFAQLLRGGTSLIPERMSRYSA